MMIIPALIFALANIALASPVRPTTINRRAAGCDPSKTHATGFIDGRQIGTREYGSKFSKPAMLFGAKTDP